MLVVDLTCGQGHRFEGWFASGDDLSAQQAKGLVTCPVCGDAHVARVPSATHLNVSGAKAAEPTMRPMAKAGPAPGQPQAPGPSSDLNQLQALWRQAVHQLVSSAEDVGDRLPDEARAIHHGDAPERAIRGQASPEERQSLRDEGIELITIAEPEAPKGSLH